jgi:hypothetical protein
MYHRQGVTCLLVTLALARVSNAVECPPPGFDSVLPEEFDLDAYVSKPWYIQQQIPVQYQSVDQLYCVRAAYKKLGDGLYQVCGALVVCLSWMCCFREALCIVIYMVI